MGDMQEAFSRITNFKQISNKGKKGEKDYVGTFALLIHPKTLYDKSN